MITKNRSLRNVLLGIAVVVGIWSRATPVVADPGTYDLEVDWITPCPWTCGDYCLTCDEATHCLDLLGANGTVAGGSFNNRTDTITALRWSACDPIFGWNGTPNSTHVKIHPFPNKHVKWVVTFVGPVDYGLQCHGPQNESEVCVFTGNWSFRGVQLIDDDCSCNGACSAGTMQPQLSSVDVTFGLGKTAIGKSAGQLLIHADNPDQYLARPQALACSALNDTETITTTVAWYGSTFQELRQVKSHEALADILDLDDFHYQINFYSLNNVGPKSGGVYQVTGDPYVTYTIRNPSASTNDYTHLVIEENRQGEVHETDYIWDQNTQSWTMSQGDGLHVENRLTSTESPVSNRVDTVTVSDSNGTLVSKVVQHWQQYTWGSNVVREVVDPDNAALTTLSFYNDTVGSNGYAQLQMQIDPTGRWERYEYDDSGRVTKDVTPFEDVSTNAVDAASHVVTTTYANVNGQLITTTITTLLGQEIARDYQIDTGGVHQEFQCQTPGADTNASDNLVTSTVFDTDGPFLNKIRSTQRPDGTVSLYGYDLASDGSTQTTTNWTGVPSADGTTVVDGTETITVQDGAGRQLSEQVYDIKTGLLISRSITTQTDPLGRPTMVVSLGGTNETSYNCCGIGSTVDAEGITTSYTYDGLKRTVTTTRAGIVTSNTYDAVGHSIATFRNGIMITSNAYDLAGRLVSTTDALTNTTTYSETTDSNNETTKTTIYPDSSTRVETYNEDGQLKSVTGTAVHAVRYEYGVETPGGESVARSYTKEIKLNADGTDTSEWTKTYTDMLGRAYKTVYSDGSYSQSFYNAAGLLVKQVDPDGVSTLFAYNAKGEQEMTAIDMDQDGTIEEEGTDRITRTVSRVLTVPSKGTVKRQVTLAFTTADSGDTQTNSIVETSISGLEIWQTRFGLTTHTLTGIDRANGRRTVTQTNPDNSYAVAQYSQGRLTANTSYDANGAPLSSVSYTYDAQGRQQTITDARTGDTTLTYNDADQQTSMSAGGQTTFYQYDPMGRVVTNTLPDGGVVVTEYSLAGETLGTHGTRTYPVAYTYDYTGRMQTMTTWQNYPDTGSATTTWKYDASRGFLIGKVYPDPVTGEAGASSVTYSNSPAGRLLTRTWARGITTTYSYNHAGDLETISYGDGVTPGVTYGYDRLGRRTSAPSVQYQYNPAGQVLSETYGAGPLNGLRVLSVYDMFMRRSFLSAVNAQSAILNSVKYGYDQASRLLTVDDQTGHRATYSYESNSSLVSNILFTSNGQTRLLTTKTWDNLNRLQRVDNVLASTSRNLSRAYQYNDANQRTRMDADNGSYWLYQYDSLGQVTNGVRYWADGSPVAGQQFGYAFDDIGNRTTAQAGAPECSSSYTANLLNQYTQRTVPAVVGIMGDSQSNGIVTVNLQPTQRHGEYWYRQIAVTNTASAQYPAVKAVGVLPGATTNSQDIVTTTSGREFVAQTPELFGYDSDGNLTNDGRWAYTWDAENRLVQMQTLPNLSAAVPQQKLLFGYDYQGRRISKVVSNLTSGSWILVSNLGFVYDGWNLIAELDGNNTPVRTYTWGLDLSGSEQGAGGIGGLLVVNDGTNGAHFVACDGNGNLTALVDADTGEASAQYEYGPFGETLRATGVTAAANPFRFSTKYADSETRLLYYGYRYYNPNTGRWISLDPSEESGGINLDATCRNDLVNNSDELGLNSESADVAALQQTAYAWGRKGWSFASNLLITFYTRAGIYYPSDYDINLIKNNKTYRQAAQTYFHSRANKTCSALNGLFPISDGKSHGPYAFEPRYWTGELLAALFGAHFYYTGSLCCGDNGTWSVRVTMTQEDDYTFEPTTYGFRLAIPSYRAAHELQMEYHYRPFSHSETWDDSFKGN